VEAAGLRGGKLSLYDFRDRGPGTLHAIDGNFGLCQRGGNEKGQPMVHALMVCALLVSAPSDPARSDAAIEEDVVGPILDMTLRREDSPFNYFEVKVVEGVVSVSGTVRHASRGRQIAREVAKIAGVRGVRNGFRSPSDGSGDERLRRELYRSIYGSSAFSRYGLHSSPPIRVLVERGKVVLAGAVSSQVERALLTNIALGSAAFEVDNQVAVDAAIANVPLGVIGVRFY
jgi:osmotically-inducible protein OsmY